jgi:hypothetical protein
MTKIIDNIVPREYENIIERLFLSTGFPWYISTKTVTPNDRSFIMSNKVTDIPQFTHMFFNSGSVTSDYFSHVKPFIKGLEEKTGRTYLDKIIRIKANLTYRNTAYPEDNYCSPHCDCSYDGGGSVKTDTLLYYVNESDGDTLVFNEMFGGEFVGNLTIKDRFSPKKGKSVLFDSTYQHAGTPPKLHDFRIVINFVFHNNKES